VITQRQEKQEREARAAGRTDVWAADEVEASPAQPLPIPPPTEETPGTAPIQDVQPIDGETVLNPPVGAEPHKLGQLQG
jgi:hypothetical protein